MGRGRYSHVFEGKDTNKKKKVVLKVLLPIKPDKIRREVHIMQQLIHPNIPKLLDVVRCEHMRTASLVL